MKYKVNDRVRIKSLDWYNENKTPKYGFVYFGHEFCFYSHMSKYCGKTLTISEIVGCCYVMAECVCNNWTDEMIEGLVEEEIKQKFKVGDKITNGKVTLTILTLSSDRYIVEDNFGELGTLCFNTQDDWKLVEEETYDFLKTDKPNLPSLNDFMDMLDNEIKLPDGYIFKDENGNVINATKIVLEKKKKEYPKTYKECCKVMGINHTNDLDICEHCDYKTEITFYEDSLLEKIETLYRLIICRDAYWKIAGEEMGFGKPWEPDWTYNGATKYCIGVSENEVRKFNSGVAQYVFAFPTEEMRDAFKENFDPDIEFCKELL